MTKHDTNPKAKATAAPAEKRGRGGVSTYTPEIADQIIARMSRGESLRGICADPGMPAAPTVRGWAVNDVPVGFAERYARAAAAGR